MPGVRYTEVKMKVCQVEPAWIKKGVYIRDMVIEGVKVREGGQG